MSLPPPGWYNDGSGRTRYWNGSAWTDQYAPAGPPVPVPVQTEQVEPGRSHHEEVLAEISKAILRIDPQSEWEIKSDPEVVATLIAMDDRAVFRIWAIRRKRLLGKGRIEWWSSPLVIEPSLRSGEPRPVGVGDRVSASMVALTMGYFGAALLERAGDLFDEKRMPEAIDLVRRADRLNDGVFQFMEGLNDPDGKAAAMRVSIDLLAMVSMAKSAAEWNGLATKSDWDGTPEEDWDGEPGQAWDGTLEDDWDDTPF